MSRHCHGRGESDSWDSWAQRARGPLSLGSASSSTSWLTRPIESEPILSPRLASSIQPITPTYTCAVPPHAVYPPQARRLEQEVVLRVLNDLLERLEELGRVRPVDVPMVGRQVDGHDLLHP